MNPNDREISKGIVVNPHRMGGTPTVQGTRIPADMILNLMSGPNSVRALTLIEDYSLSYTDIVNVRGWARKGRPR